MLSAIFLLALPDVADGGESRSDFACLRFAATADWAAAAATFLSPMERCGDVPLLNLCREVSRDCVCVCALPSATGDAEVGLAGAWLTRGEDVAKLLRGCGAAGRCTDADDAARGGLKGMTFHCSEIDLTKRCIST